MPVRQSPAHCSISAASWRRRLSTSSASSGSSRSTSTRTWCSSASEWPPRRLWPGLRRRTAGTIRPVVLKARVGSTLKATLRPPVAAGLHLGRDRDHVERDAPNEALPPTKESPANGPLSSLGALQGG